MHSHKSASAARRCGVRLTVSSPMPSPKTPQMILADFDEYFPKPEFKSDSDQLLADMLSAAHQKSYHDWLRSALASYLMHLKGEMPQAWQDAEVRRLSDNSKGYEDAVRTVHTLLDEKIRKLTE